MSVAEGGVIRKKSENFVDISSWTSIAWVLRTQKNSIIFSRQNASHTFYILGSPKLRKYRNIIRFQLRNFSFTVNIISINIKFNVFLR